MKRYLVLALACGGCTDRASAECIDRTDCGPGEQCLVWRGRDGACIEATEAGDPEPLFRYFPEAGLDVLLVIDESSTMAQAQARLARSIEALTAELEQRQVDYRIGITTTDNGNPACDAARSESGMLVMSDCRERLDDFVAPDGTDSSWVCEQSCMADGPMPPLRSTTTRFDTQPRPRPWLEPGSIPAGTSLREILSCTLPQGTSGCPFEAPLESVYAAAARSFASEGPSRGFLRGQPVAVVVVTDSADCSLTAAGRSVFDPDGDRTLWDDPGAGLPQPGLCWRAGVACEAEASGPTTCEAVDVPVPGNADGDSILQPVERYAEHLYKSLSWWGVPSFDFIVGVPVDFDPDAELDYTFEHDLDYVAEYGVDPGCDDGVVRAVPPVRMRAAAEAAGLLGMADRVSSICADDYGDALRRVAERAGPPPHPCLYRCAAVEPPEELWLELPDLRRLEVPQCEREAERFVIPDGAAACWGYREGAEHCRDERLVELVLKRADVSVPSAFLYRRSSGCAEP